MINRIWTMDNEPDMVALGETIGRILTQQNNGITVFLEGDLGAGKTTLCRGILRAFGHQGAVKSPTYTLVETYEFAGRQVNHFDLYRLGHAEELEYIGIRDYFVGDSIALMEWPERGRGMLPKPDLLIDIKVAGSGRSINLTANTPVGSMAVQTLL